MAVWWVLSMLYFFCSSAELYTVPRSGLWHVISMEFSALVPQMSFHGETSGGIMKVLVVFLLLHVRKPKTVLDSGIQVLNASLCQWNLDSRFQLLVGFRIPWDVFRILKARIPDSTSKMLNIRINFLDSKSGLPYVERFLGYLLVLFLFVRSV